jgi:hypothetical protein
MYHPDKYQLHNEALKRFCAAFNAAAAQCDNIILMKPSDGENFRDDGEIVYQPDGTKILYDFEKRNRYYHTCSFPFKDFGQFERKIQKPEISLSIQCSHDEQCFCIAWHDDFRKEPVKQIGSVTATGAKEFTGKRFTRAFRELKYSEMETFYRMLKKAFAQRTFNASCFNYEPISS